MSHQSTKHPKDILQALEIVEGQYEAVLDRQLAMLTVFRRHAPKATFPAAMLFMLIARRTIDRRKLNIPTPKQMAEALDASQSSISNLLSTLSVRGRVRADRKGSDEESGFGLIETDDWLQGRRAGAYVLTQKGRACLNEMMQALTGDPTIELQPHDGASLFRLLVDQKGRKKM